MLVQGPKQCVITVTTYYDCLKQIHGVTDINGFLKMIDIGNTLQN